VVRNWATGLNESEKESILDKGWKIFQHDPRYSNMDFNGFREILTKTRLNTAVTCATSTGRVHCRVKDLSLNYFAAPILNRIRNSGVQSSFST